MMQTATRKSIGAAMALALVVGCQSPGRVVKDHSQGVCLHCAENPGNQHKLAGTPFVTEWLPPERRASSIRGIDFENRNGAGVSFSELRGAPLAVSFIYARRDDERKCPLVARTLGELALLVKDTPFSPKPSFLLLAYDPEVDAPSELKKFASAHGFRWTLLLGPQSEEAVFSKANMRVNHNERGVSLHGIQLILLDKEGRYVRTYHSLLWDNAQVLHDLERLAAE